MKELKATLKDTEYLLDGLMENPLPDAIEIKLKSNAFTPENIKALTSKLSQIQGIHEIEYGEKMLSSILTIRTGISTVGIIFIAIMASGMIFVCYSTVKILFYRKNIEIETYKLLGATKGFIRAPFVIEGAVIGGLGGILSLIVIFLVYYSVIHRLSLTFALFKAIIFPVEIVLTLPLVGLFLGITGALIAIGRIRY
jgi:cell division transport system permease protein